jgi:hypothetical protein
MSGAGCGGAAVPNARILACVLCALFPLGASAQAPACPPGVPSDAPTIGGPPSDKPLSDRLAESKGVICPPAGVDPEIRKPPPEGGALRVIPPPGSPGGDQRLQPK